MLQLFKSNQTGVILLLFLYLAVLKAAQFIFPVEVEVSDHGPLSYIFFQNLGDPESWNYYLHISLASVFIFIQALLVNHYVNKFKLLPAFTFLPALAFILFSSFFDGFTWMSPVLLGNFFVILAMDRIFGLYKSEHNDSSIFDAAFLITLAALFYIPFSIFYLWLFIAMISLRTSRPREWLIILSGIFVPCFLLFAILFWYDQHYLLLQRPFEVFATFDVELPAFAEIGQVLKIGITLLLALVFYLNIIQSTATGVIQLRKYIFLLLVFTILCVVFMFLPPGNHPTRFYPLVIPLSVVFAYNFMVIQKKKFTEIAHLVLLTLILINQYLNFADIRNFF